MVHNSQGGVDVGNVPGSPEFGVVLQDRDDDMPGQHVHAVLAWDRP